MSGGRAKTASAGTRRKSSSRMQAPRNRLGDCRDSDRGLTGVDGSARYSGGATKAREASGLVGASIYQAMIFGSELLGPNSWSRKS